MKFVIGSIWSIALLAGGYLICHFGLITKLVECVAKLFHVS